MLATTWSKSLFPLFREAVLRLSHGETAGHTGVRKTYNRVMRRFFWPKLKKNVADYIRTCHTCQITGKPNQSLPVAPLCPIPAVSKPFQYLLANCVGPLPRSRAGHGYLLTIMCQSTRYPEAYPLHSITTKSIQRALTTYVNFWYPFDYPNRSRVKLYVQTVP